MKVAIHQPNFAPWLGFFQKLVWADVFVLFDDVQTPRGKSFVNRVLVKTSNGPAWLTVPVSGRGGDPLISELLLADDSTWKRKALKTLRISYSKAKHFDAVFSVCEEVFGHDHQRVFDLNRELIERIADLLNSRTEIVRSSALGRSQALSGAEKIENILTELKATDYLTGSGAGSRRYIDADRFRDLNIALHWQDFVHPRYEQGKGEFLTHLSTFDALFHCGGDGVRKMLEVGPYVKKEDSEP